jgi:TonB family protein
MSIFPKINTMNRFFFILILSQTFVFGFAQDIGYQIQGIYKKSIHKENLHNVKSISDINPGFPSSWINSYHSVEISVIKDDVVNNSIGQSEELSTDQIAILEGAEIGDKITINVHYFPKHSDESNMLKKISLTYTIIPEIEATYPGGQSSLNAYFKENAIDKIADFDVTQPELAKLKFTVNQHGSITDIKISKSSGINAIDQLLIDAIANMPKWQPAENSEKEQIIQEFELSVGNMVGC